ncbi:hypothetical protein [Sporosarcina sp. NPDC096371]|uniref:hypothetical protein n=1 Tax=Sporosarcina sp. NPDC096371 TaxID=3364530 RepID=UPI0037F437BA
MRFRKRTRFLKSDDEKTTTTIMGAELQKPQWRQREINEEKETNPQIEVEQFFRPSSRSILNRRLFGYQFFDPYINKTYDEIQLSSSLMDAPEGMLLNYFSILREAENLTNQLIGGCGTVGWVRIPFPIAYNFFTKSYQQKTSYSSYLSSFEGVGHTNLIKLYKLQNPHNVQPIQFFVELETINGTATGATGFQYHYGIISVIQEDGLSKIDAITLTGEDFLCAAYHGWRQQGEGVVDVEYGNWCKLIKKRLPTKRDGYVKTIDVIGTDGDDYRFIFIQLTNDTDVLVSQLVKRKKGQWEVTYIDPTKCTEK